MSKNITEKDILDRINNIDVYDLESIQFYKSDSELKYEDFLNTWKNFIETRFFEDKSSNLENSDTMFYIYNEQVLGLLLKNYLKNN